MMNGKSLWFALLVVVAAAATGCEGNVLDCADVCNAYNDCYDGQIDVARCTENCRDEAEDSEAHEQRLEECELCVEDAECPETGVFCEPECSPVVDEIAEISEE